MKLLYASFLLMILFVSSCSTKNKIDDFEQNITEQEIESIHSSLKNLNRLQETINELEKNRTDIQYEFKEQKRQLEILQNSLTEYEREIKKQKSFSMDKDSVIIAKNNEISELKKNIEKLKDLDSYNEHKLLKNLEAKYHLLQKQLENLLKEQKDLQNDLEQIKHQNSLLKNEAETWKTMFKDFELNFNDRVKEEKAKLRSKYNEKLNKITEDIIADKNINYDETNLKKGQQVGKIIEILNGKITFRFNNENLSKHFINGDKLYIVRNVAGNLVNVGTLEITNVSPFSTFGRAVIDNLKSEMNVYPGDFIVIKNNLKGEYFEK